MRTFARRFGDYLNAITAPLAAFACGVAAATGFQPLMLWPIALVGLALLMAMLRRADGWRRVALLGWLFGVGHFWFGNNWIATAFTYQAEMPAWLGWIAVFLIALYLAIYPMLAALAAWFIVRSGPKWAFVLAFGGAWIVTEWMRSWVFSGFAWNPLGAIALGPFGRPGLALALPWLGTYALSGLVVLLAGAWLCAVAAWRERGSRWWAALAAILPVVLMLAPFPSPGRGEGTLPYRLVQPDVRQEVLDDPRYYETNFIKTAALSGKAAPSGDDTLYLWPESGVPDYLRPGYPYRYYLATTYAADPDKARKRIGEVIGPGGLLLTGAVDLVIDADRQKAVGARNVVTAIGPGGKIVGGYAKAHLVPFGEYLPLRSLLEPIGLSRFVAGTLDFESSLDERIGGHEWLKAKAALAVIAFAGRYADGSDQFNEAI